MFYLNAFSTVFSFITLVHTRELTPFFHFISKHPSIHLHFWLFSICSTIGQLFIFLTIKTFGPVVFAIIMSTRILLSIAASCFLYGHPIPPLGKEGMEGGREGGREGAGEATGFTTPTSYGYTSHSPSPSLSHTNPFNRLLGLDGRLLFYRLPDQTQDSR